jgi:hypothetical protein
MLWPGPFKSEAPRALHLLSLERHEPRVERETECSARTSIRALALPLTETRTDHTAMTSREGERLCCALAVVATPHAVGTGEQLNLLIQ